MMRTFLRSLATVVLLALAYGVLLRAFDLMNLPSDRSFYTGGAMVLGLLLVVPVLIRFIWKKEN